MVTTQSNKLRYGWMNLIYSVIIADGSVVNTRIEEVKFLLIHASQSLTTSKFVTFSVDEAASIRK